MKWVYATLLAYVVGMSLFWPRVFLVVDEQSYVGQAMAFSEGRTAIADAGVVFPKPRVQMISNYPPGTSLLQAPLVRLFGWRGAVVVSVLSLIIATLLTARWLREAGKDPAFALVLPGYAGAALFGRIAMSDIPATALVAATCYLLWTARSRPSRSALAAFCAGAILLFREPPIMIAAPLFLGAAMRRDIHIGAAMAGGIGALALRFGAAYILFGTAWYAREPGPGFSVSSLAHSIPIYSFLLLVMLPGGALLPFLYRGPRRPELLTAFWMYLVVFLLFGSNSVEESGLVKGLLHASRYMAPLLPILAFQGADVWPRLYARLRARSETWRVLPRGLAAGVVGMAFLIHPAAHLQERVPLAIVRGFYSHTASSQYLITNTDATLKYLNVAYGPRKLILRYGLSLDSVTTFSSRYGPVAVALLDRTDSDLFRRDAEGNAEFLASVSSRCETRSTYDENIASWARVRILELGRCR
jgi:hypothetical protein